MRTIARRDWSDDNGLVHKNDIYLVCGQLATISGKDGHAQVIESVIKTVYGELQLDTTEGIPYFTTVFQDNRHVSIWAAAVRDAVSGLDFVEEIQSFEYEYDFHNQKLTYTLTVETEDGEVTIEE